MNSLSDVGGMHGFGPVPVQKNSTEFDSQWQAEGFALMLVSLFTGCFNIDEARHKLESVSPADYLSKPQYQHWLEQVEGLLLEKGIVTAEDLARAVKALEGGKN